MKRVSDSIWNPYTVPPGGDSNWNPYTVPTGGNEPGKYGATKPNDAIWNPYTMPPPGATGASEIDKNQVKKSTETVS